MTNLLKGFGSVLVAAGILYAILSGFGRGDWSTWLIVTLCFVGLGMFFLGFAELLEILGGIRNELSVRNNGERKESDKQ